MQDGLNVQTAFSGINDRNSSLQRDLDAQVPEIEMDSRKGSPCQQAAAELMDPSVGEYTPGRESSMGTLGLGSTLSQTLADSFITQSNPQQEAQVSPAPLATQPPTQPDWLAVMMEQAQSVGLWGGPLGESRPERVPSPPTGLPILPDSLLSRAAAGVENEERPGASRLAVYELGMASLLAEQLGDAPSWPRCPPAEGVGLISQDLRSHSSSTSQPPRLQPVSLGMAAADVSATLAGLHRNDGPYRPPTRPRMPGSQPGSGSEMLHPMLQQSKLQLSLGLAADKPLDLKGWGYGEASASAEETALGSALADDLRPAANVNPPLTPSAAAAQLASCLQPVAIRPALSESTNPGSVPVSPAVSQNPGGVPQANFRMPTLSTMSGSATTLQLADMEAEYRSKSMVDASSAGQVGHEDGASRAECLERYREKKRRRLFSKTIRYHKRKVNADKRPRVKGRFVKASETSAAPADDDAVASEEHES